MKRWKTRADECWNRSLLGGGGGRKRVTFARFLRHSVHALGVTTPGPRRRLLEGPAEGKAAGGALGVPEVAEEESACAGPAEAGVPAAAALGG